METETVLCLEAGPPRFWSPRDLRCARETCWEQRSRISRTKLRVSFFPDNLSHSRASLVPNLQVNCYLPFLQVSKGSTCVWTDGRQLTVGLGHASEYRRGVLLNVSAKAPRRSW